MTSTNSERLERASGPSRRLLAVLVGLLLALAAILSGAPSAVAQNAVGPQPVAMILTVGPHSAAVPGSVGVRGPPQLRLASATGVPAEAAGGAIAFGPGTEKAWSVLDRVASKGAPLPGYKGGSVFKNLEGRLPVADGAGNSISYREWDVNPYVKGVDRGPERLVTGSDGSAYYTGDHYGSLLQFWGAP